MTVAEIKLPPMPKGMRFDARAFQPGEVRVLTGPNVQQGEIEAFGAIGEDVTPSRISSALRQIGDKPVTVGINSRGGSFSDGVAIYNLLRAHSKPVTVQILGIAASAASVVAMAGSRIEIAKSAELMLHTSWSIAIGPAALLDVAADHLRQTDAIMAKIYADRTRLPLAHVSAMMARDDGNGTFMFGQEAVDLGFADALLDRDAETKHGTRASAAPATVREFEAALRELGYSKSHAARAAARAWPALTGENDADLDAVAAAFESHTAAMKKLSQG